MNRQDDFALGLFQVHDNLFDQDPHDLLLEDHAGLGMMPNPVKVFAQLVQLPALLGGRHGLPLPIETGELFLFALHGKECFLPFLCQAL